MVRAGTVASNAALPLLGRFRWGTMKPAPAKHSVVLHGHKTSVSLEPAFWQVLLEAAQSRR
jgi:hypothetical protein